MKEAGDVPQKAGPDFLSDAQRPSFGGFLLDCIRLEILSKSDIRILDLTLIYQNTIRRVHLQMGQYYINTSIGASSEKKGKDNIDRKKAPNIRGLSKSSY